MNKKIVSIFDKLWEVGAINPALMLMIILFSLAFGGYVIIPLFIYYLIIRGSVYDRQIEESVFKAKVRDDKIEVNGNTLDVFKIDIKGAINGPHDNFYMKFMIRMYDVTNKEYPIFSTIEEFQEVNSRVFFYESKMDELPYKGTLFNDWTGIIAIPKFLLEFPKKGNRRIKVEVFAIDALTRNILAKDSTEITYLAKEKGYIDRKNDIVYFEEMTIKTMMIVSASDGYMDEKEAKVIKNWVKKRISSYSEEYQSEHKEHLNKYIKEAYEEIQNGYIDIYDVLDDIENIASEGDKYELFQLCLDVAKADGEADTKELEIINEIADYIDLDEKQFRSMIEKSLPIHIHTGKQAPEQVIGITSSMSNDEIQKHLRVAFKKWNAVVAHNDAEKREQAEEMLKIITELRSKYK